MITSLILAGRSSRVASESVMSEVKPAVTVPATSEGVTPIEPVEAEKNTQAEPSAVVPTPEKQQTTPVAGEEKAQ
jgi:hypothetical protein